MEIKITVTDKRGEITIRRFDNGERDIDGEGIMPVSREVIEQAMDLIEKEAKE